MSNFIKIKSIELFAKSIRKNIAMAFPKSYSDQIDKLISVDQTENLIRKYVEPGYNNQFIISTDEYNYLCFEIKKWIYNSSLSQVASSGKIECAWDDDSNEMIFWHPESNETFNTIK